MPFGNEEAKRTIYTVDISNQAKKTKKGRYRYRATITPQPFKLASGKPDFSLAHFREDGAIKLARMALKRAEGLYPLG